MTDSLTGVVDVDATSTVPPAPIEPLLLAIGDGDPDPATQQAERVLLRAVAGRRPELTIHRIATVAGTEHMLADRLDRLGATPVNVVPLHLHPSAERVAAVARGAAAASDAWVARSLSPDARVVGLLADRLVQAGCRPTDRVVLCAAGSDDDRSIDGCEEVARRLSALLRERGHHDAVSCAFVATTLPDLVGHVRRVRDGRAPGARVVAAAYVLGAGAAYRAIARGGADVVTDPLIRPGEPPSPDLVDLVLDRYEEAGG